MMERMAVRHKGIEGKWFRSMLTMVIVVLSISLLLFAYLIRELRLNMMQISSDVSVYVQQNIDNRLDEVRRISVQIELNSANGRLKRALSPPIRASEEHYLLCDQLYAFRGSSNLIERVFVYYPKIRRIASDIGFFSADAYYALESLNAQSIFRTWRPGDALNSGIHYSPVRNGEEWALVFSRAMKSSDGSVAGIIIMQIDTESLMGTFSGANKRDQVSGFGLWVDGQLIESTGADTVTAAMRRLNHNHLPEGRVYADQGLSAYMRASTHPHITYVTAFSQHALFETLYIATALCAGGLLFCLAFGIWLSLRVSRRNAQPLVNILSRFPDASISDEDEYQYIGEKIDQLHSDKQKTEQQLREQRIVIDGMFLSTILKGELKDEYAIFGIAKNYDVVFENPMYQVVVLSPIHHVLPAMQLMQKLNGMGIDAITIQRENRAVVLLNTDATLDTVGAEALHDALKAHPDATISVGIGMAYDMLEGIYNSYREALCALPADQVIAFYKNEERQSVIATEEKSADDNRRPKDSSVPDRAMSLIQQHYADPMLGLYMLSEQLKVSNSYLSTCFKARFDIGVVQYIHQLRIEKAKQLILSTDMSIKNIATTVGFSSDVSFIRVFKKYEELTPTEYRKASN